MVGIKELNNYFEKLAEKEEPAEVITELQQAMGAMAKAIEQKAILQANREELKTEEITEVTEVEEKEL